MENKQTRTAILNAVKSEEKRLSFVIVSNDNACMRFDFELGLYKEYLEVSGAKFDELKTLFKDHEPSVDNAIARVENVRVENNQLLCDCVFGDDDNSNAIFKKYEQGILSDVSIGYNILDYEITRGENPQMLVKSYNIFELSAVWKGADKNAKKREAELMKFSQLKAINEARERELKLMQMQIN